jgi:iron complex transport system ATP-binding protein
MELLTVTKLQAGYQDFTLGPVSFQIKQGIIAGIIGPNGSGKTTLIKTICRHLPMQKGRILYRGENLKDLKPGQVARRMAVVPQTSVVPALKVQDYILLGRIPHFRRWQYFDDNRNYSVARRIMDTIGISRFSNRFLHELSGGEQQLCHIARALTQEPELLILDEPTSFLDINHQARIMKLLLDFNRFSKLTILMVVHDLNLAGNYCSNLLLLQRGIISVQGPPKHVLTKSHIEAAYRVPVVISRHPLSGRPTVFSRV